MRLFNGVTVYHYFSGARPTTLPHDAGFGIVVGAALGGLVLTPQARHRRLDYGLILACAIVWIGFYPKPFTAVSDTFPTGTSTRNSPGT